MKFLVEFHSNCSQTCNKLSVICDYFFSLVNLTLLHPVLHQFLEIVRKRDLKSVWQNALMTMIIKVIKDTVKLWKLNNISLHSLTSLIIFFFVYLCRREAIFLGRSWRRAKRYHDKWSANSIVSIFRWFSFL